MNANLIVEVGKRLRAVLPAYLPVLIGSMILVRGNERPRAESMDLLAEWCAEEALALLGESPAKVFEAYVCLEVAAEREPEKFGLACRGFRDRVMGIVLDVAREKRPLSDVPDTTVAGRWVSGHEPNRVRAEQRGSELRVYLADGSVIVLKRHFGVNGDCDA